MSHLNKELKQKLNQLQDDVDSKEVQIAFLESEMQDVIAPSDLLIDIKSIVMDMMFELVQFEKAKGETKKSKTSKGRLEKILELINNLGGITYASYNLKGSNRLIHAKYQILRVENSELKAELKKKTDMEAFLNEDN